ncbi:Rieske 2Fe-2S domain-containing protein [Magnetospira thiophila]
MPHVLCVLDNISSPGSIAAVAMLENGPTAIMIIRQGPRVHGYVNKCPHIGAPLDLQEGQFLSLDNTRILCSTHGAHFRIADGACLSGPCQGRGLIPVPLKVVDGAVYLDF